MKRKRLLSLACALLLGLPGIGLLNGQVVLADTVLAPVVGVTYRGHVQNIGWQPYVSDGAEAGTTGEGLRVEALNVNLVNAPAGAHIEYQGHVQNIGWQATAQDGAEVGTNGLGLRVEAFKFTLVGMPGYTVQYRAHVQNMGWQNWVSDGQIAGTTGQGLRVEAMEIKVVKVADGSTPTEVASSQFNVASVILNKTDDSLNIGDSDKLAAVVSPTNATNQSVTWTSSNNQLATVDATGTVTAIGAGSVVITATTVDGNKSASCNVTVSNAQTSDQSMPSIVDIDTPLNNSYVSSDNTLNVVGWSLNGNGVKKVQVYLDDVYTADATIGLPRADVDRNHPGYTGGVNSGYSASLTLPTLSGGTHTIKVVSTGNDGSVATGVINITKASEENTPGIVNIDTPNYSQVQSDQITVSGWSLDLNGIKSVQVSVDNGKMQAATIGLYRQDVINNYPQYGNLVNSGFTTNLDISKLSPGIHTITVVSTGSDGTTATNSTEIDILSTSASNLPSLVYLDTPQNDTFIKAENYLFNVTGWSLDVFGVKGVQIYVDNIYTGDATIGLPRPDVDNQNPGYTGGVNSGYNYLMDISSLSYGAHDLSIRSTGNDGVVTTTDVVIYKVYNNTNFASTIVSFLNIQSNLNLAEGQALNLHNGVSSNNCVYFSSSVLRDIGINVPTGMANTQHYVPFIAAQGFVKDNNVDDLYPGNICFTVSDGTGYPTHTFIFMGWVNPFDHTLAYVADNQSNVIHIRSMIDAPGIDAFSFGFHN